MEALLRNATQRKARMEITAGGRRPCGRMIEAAMIPKVPWQLKFQLDLGLVILVFLLVVVLVVSLVDMFRRDEAMSTVDLDQSNGQAVAAYGVVASGQGPMGPTLPMLAREGDADLSGTAFLVDPFFNPPRELLNEELQILLDNADEPVKLFIHLLLRGLRPQEIIALRGRDINVAKGTLRLVGDHARQLSVDKALQAWFLAHPMGHDQPLFSLSQEGISLPTLEELTTGLLYAAHDAKVDQPAEITPEAIWHTAVASLARQGLRFSDLSKWVGHLSIEQAALYIALSPGGTSLGLDQVQRLMPAASELRIRN